MRRQSLILAGLCVLLAVSPAAAQNPGPAGNGDSGYLGEILVTATREGTRRADLPEATGVIGSDAIDDMKPTNAPAILERIAGVHVNWLGGDHHGASIRQPISFEPVYLYLENGVPTRSPGFFNVNTLIEMNVPMADRVEITKGPGTALYGSDAIAAVINLITPPPPPPGGPLIAELSAEAGAYGWRRGMASIGERFGRHGLRADLNLTSEDGWRDSTNYDRQIGNFSWHYNGRRWQAETTITAGHVDQQSSGSNLTRAAFENTPKVNFAPFAVREIDFIRGHTKLERGLAGGVLSITPFFRYTDVTLLPAFALGFDPHIEFTENGSVGALLKYRRDRDFGGAILRWIAGIDFDYTAGRRFERRLDVVREGEFFTDFTLRNPIYDFDVAFFAVSPYGHVELDIGERLHLSAGLRFDAIRYDYENRLGIVTDPAAPHKRPPSQNVHFRHLSPKVGLTYDFTDALNAYVSFRHAFRVPTESQLFRPGRARASTDLEPVKADNIETGLRGRLGRRADFRLTYYRLYKRDDILAFNVTETGERFNVNAGETLHRGIEFGLDLFLAPSLRLSTVYSRNRHEFRDWKPDTDTDFTGNELQRAPRDVANTRLVWTPAWLGTGRLEAEWVHLGSYFMNDENTVKYEGHDLLNLRGNADVTPHVELFARLHNVTDKRYAVLARFTEFTGERLKPGLPRTLFAGLRLKLP